MSRGPRLRSVDELPAPRPEYKDERQQITIKYPGQLVINAGRPTMIVMPDGKLARWDGQEGRDAPVANRG